MEHLAWSGFRHQFLALVFSQALAGDVKVLSQLIKALLEH